jgi:hypothetical protein
MDARTFVMDSWLISGGRSLLSSVLIFSFLVCLCFSLSQSHHPVGLRLSFVTFAHRSHMTSPARKPVLHQSCGVMIAATNSRKISTPSTKALLAEHHSSRHHLLRLSLPTLFYLIPHMINPDCIKLLVRSQLSFAPCGFSSAFTLFNDLASSVVTLFVFIRNEQEKLCSPHPVPREMFFLHSLFWVVRPV